MDKNKNEAISLSCGIFNSNEISNIYNILFDRQLKINDNEIIIPVYENVSLKKPINNIKKKINNYVR